MMIGSGEEDMGVMCGVERNIDGGGWWWMVVGGSGW